MMDETIEVLTKGDEWDELARDLQTVVADEVTKSSSASRRAARASAPRSIELLSEEDLGASVRSAGHRQFDVARPVAGQGARPDGARPARRRSATASPASAARRAAS